MSAARSRAFGGLVSALERLDGPRADILAVLTYHRIADRHEDGHLDPALVSATPEEFERQIAFLAETRRLISLAELLAVRDGNARLKPGAVLVTFDDAYRDFADHAWPTLRRYDAPVTLFVATGYPDRPERAFWWDRLHHALVTTRREAVDTPEGRFKLAGERERAAAMRALRQHLGTIPHSEALAAVARLSDELGVSAPPPAVLGWADLRRLAREGVTLAPHSRAHPRLDRIPLEEARAEIVGSLADLERETGPAPRVFAYPGGGYTAEVVRLLAELGFAAAFTTSRGLNDLRRGDWLQLRRINVGRRANLSLLRAQLLSWGSRRDGRAATGAR